MPNYTSIDQLPPEYREQAAAQIADKRPSRHESLKARPVVQFGQHVDAQARDHKYNAKKTTIDGVTFDSKKEAQRYTVLQARVSAGEIHALQPQPRFELQPAFKDVRGKTVRAIYYVADFQYVENGHIIVEDVKGMETAVFKLKRKLFLYRYGRQVVLRIIK